MEPVTVHRPPPRQWIGYLSLVTGLSLSFGAVLVALPQVTQDAFGWMVFGSSGFPPTFSIDALAYVQLAHAVIGAVMVGWFALMLWLVRGPLAHGLPGAWSALALSLSGWYLLDTSFSLLSGFWQNAVLNTVVLIAFLPGLAATRPRRPPRR